MSSRLKPLLTAILFALAFFTLDRFGSTRAQSVLPPKPQRVAPAQKAQDPPPPEKQADYSAEAFVIEQIKMLYRFEKDGTGQRELSLRVKVQSEAGVERFGQLVFSYSSANEKLDIDFVRVRKADGTAVTAAASDVQDLSAPLAREAPVYTDLRQKHVTVRALRPGDVLEYHAVWQVHTPLAPNHFWLDHDFVRPGTLIVFADQLEVNIPSDSKVKLKTAAGIDPVIKDLDGRRIYTWQYANLKRADKDKDKEDEEAKEEKESDDDPKPPQVQMTTFQSWAEVGAWYAGLERDRIVPDDKIRAKAQELVTGRANDKDKIEALYEYVAKNFRYVSLSLGQGRYQPHAAADVFANQYGDCKDKHTLLSAMLIAAGLRAFPALMNSSRKIDPDMPSPGQFDHVISAIPLGAELLWMDTTAEVAPFRLISPPLRDKKALLVPNSGPAHLETTPAEPPFLSTELIEMEGEVSDLGKLTGHAHLTLRGDAEMYLRVMFRGTPQSDWDRLGYYLSMAAGVRGQEVTKIKPGDPAAIEKPFEVNYDFTSKDFLDWSSKKMKLSVPLPSVHLNYAERDKTSDSKPIQLGPPVDITYRLKITFPAKYQTRVPLPLKVSRDYAEYSSTYTLTGSTLVAERKLRLRQHELPAARSQDYAAFVAAARADEAQTLSLETDVAGTPPIPTTVKTEDLIQAAEAAIKNDNYPMAEELLKRVIEKDAKNKNVRRQLGFVLFAQQKYDAAIAVFQEQTKINPFDDYSYDLMGRVYWRQQKYEEAATSFRKQIEVTPLSISAHSNLGQMLVDWRKYKEAVPELEQAISLNSEGEFLYLSLGRAYLNLRENDKAMVAFDKAIKLAPGPAVWNNVSYYLSEGKVQLDKAQQYAESAVTQIATELRNVELNQITMDDLGHVESLAAYWDTLGWVQFQKGNLDRAEQYISAAWSLGQHSEVGYHLGQILEKRGKKDDAIHMYALAATAERRTPDARESLDRLAGKDRSESFFQAATNEFRELRTVILGSSLKNVKGEAQFYVVLVPGPARNAQVTEVKFIQGEEKLKSMGAALKGTNFKFVFPDETATKVIRRGTLFCQASSGECKFLMVSPENVFSVE